MAGRMKQYLPKPLTSFLVRVKQNTYAQWRKKNLFNAMRKKHTHLLTKVKKKNKIKVVFLVIHQSVWKVESVFIKMLNDPFFEPEILICPAAKLNEKQMKHEMELTYQLFARKGYPVQKALTDQGQWLKLEQLKPDLVFFTNPHPVTHAEYYEQAYTNYLSCYVPYHHEVGSYGNNIDQYNSNFHNSMWLIFASHHASFDLFYNAQAAKAANVVVTGYPAMEELLEKKNSGVFNDAWKTNDGRLRVIWAPHHTIDDPVLPYSNFLRYAEKMQQLSIQHKETMVWSYKPHPVLKEKLYLHSNWGKKKTDDFYSFWSGQEFTQLDEGEYVDLFLSSDLMIHDSGSFLAEYLYLEKPVLYLISKQNDLSYFSSFGLNALKACELGYEFEDIQKFINQALAKSLGVKKPHADFIADEVLPYFFNKSPSTDIVKLIKEGLKQP